MEDIPKNVQPPKDKSGLAIASFVLGILGFIAWCLPIIGFPVQITGLVLGIMGANSSKRSLAITGIVLCVLGIIASCVNAAIGAYMGLTGQLQFLQ